MATQWGSGENEYSNTIAINSPIQFDWKFITFVIIYFPCTPPWKVGGLAGWLASRCGRVG